MFITNGNIESVIQWFNKKDNHYKYLCLLVAGHFNDKKFFTSVFEHKEILDIITGGSLAILLFHDNQSDTLTFSVDANNSDGRVVPGKLILPSTYESTGFYIESVTEIDDEKLKNSVIKASQTISKGIINHFNLGIDDIPCILLVDKNHPEEPTVIPTRGEVDIKNLYEFFKELRIFLDQYSPLIRGPIMYSSQHLIDIYNEQGKLKEERQIIETTLKTLQDDDGSIHLKDRKLTKQKRRLKGVNKEIVNNKRLFDTELSRCRDIVIKNKEVEDKILSLANKYEKKFYVKAKTRPLRELLSSIFKISQRTREILSLEEQLNNILTR
jgi:hypothetical protein